MILSQAGTELQIPRGTCPDGMPWFFVQVPHNASTSMSVALGVKPRQHIPASEMGPRVDEEPHPAEIYFGVVRNPYDRVVSQYLYRARRNGRSGYVGSASFTEWVRLAYQERHPRYINNPLMFEPQHRWLAGCSHVMRYERLAREWAELAPVLGLSTTLPRENESTAERPTYDAESRAIIRAAFTTDFETYGYDY